MAINNRFELKSIRTFPALIRYLRDELGWPIENADFEELTFEYTPEELGIDSASAAKIQEIKRLRPLTAKQPWGIFFVKFEPKQLPVVALRRILSRVVLKKRASANSAERAAWAADDLLFISNFGAGEERQISFAHFSDDESRVDLPILKVLGWDNLDTQLHLDHVVDLLHKHLAWPEDETDTEVWRQRWRSAFTLRHREVITTSRDLSIRLAELARAIRDRINTALAIETQAGPLTVLMKTFREALVHDLDAAGFADMYAQTIAYGLLSARITDPTANTADDLALHMRTNPFLRELMEAFLHVGGRKGKAGAGAGIDFDELGVSEVVELLDDANMEAVVRDFGDRNPQEDPVIHFYELFLKEYDAKKRMQRGVFYTPRPVVSYIVRSADELLRTEFGLVDGLADTTSWGEMSKRHKDLKVPPDVDSSQAFVQILDPATGTGTFLVEVIDLIHRRLAEKWKDQGHDQKDIDALWNRYVPEHLLPRLHGYELLMAPYAISHLKVGLKLHETGYDFGSDERARIYLTNALEPAHDFSGQFEFAIPALAHEAQAVNKIKRTQRFTVVIGNPPYANYSANLSAQSRALVDEYRSFGGIPIRERNQLQFERNLQDDFVKFVSVAEHELQNSGVGVLSYITNATMLASSSLRGLREHLLSEFAVLYDLHLHGGVNEIGQGSHEDKNVFDISQAVGIHAYVRKPSKARGVVHFSELWGPREGKYSFLASHTVSDTDWEQVTPDRETCAFVPQDRAGDYVAIRIDEVFAQFGAGVKTNRDAVAIAFSKTALLEAVARFSAKLAKPKIADAYVEPILYRPFDERLVFYHEDVVASRSLPTMQHVLAGPNVGLVASSTWTTPDRFSIDVSRRMVEMKTGTHDRGTSFFPLYRYDSLLGSRPEKVPNFRSDFVRLWKRLTGARLSTGGDGATWNAHAVEEVFNWIYGLCHSNEYRRRLRARLAQGFAIVLFPQQRELLGEVARLGGELVDLHLCQSPKLGRPITTYVGPANPEVGRIGWSNDTVWLDAAATRRGRPASPGSIGFRGVDEAVWNFHVGGYQVCHKWLKDRKGRTLSEDELSHYQKIIVILAETIRLMGRIDEAIERHGGWPDAFLSEEADSSDQSLALKL